MPVPVPQPIQTNLLEGEDSAATPITPQPSAPQDVGENDFPTANLTGNQTMISEDARQASNARSYFLNHISPYNAVGSKYYAEGDWVRAKAEFQAALQLNPENSEAALALKRIDAKVNSGSAL